MLMDSERLCRACGATIPPRPPGPGRPRIFCSVACRRRHHHALEQAAAWREVREEQARRRYEYEVSVWGKRKADQLRRERESG